MINEAMKLVTEDINVINPLPSFKSGFEKNPYYSKYDQYEYDDPFFDSNLREHIRRNKI
jgi:hypothetical protein